MSWTSHFLPKLPENVSLAGAFLNLHVHKATSGPGKNYFLSFANIFYNSQLVAFDQIMF